MRNDRWTAEEYREFLRTGREPIRASGNVKSCRGDSVPGRDETRWLSDRPLEPLRPRKQEPSYASERTEGTGDLSSTCHDAPKKRKYRNEPVIVDGIRFDSKHEAAVYADLMRQVKAGVLRCVCRQVGFDLPGGIRYFADFVVIYPDNHIEVLDAKSKITRRNRVYINKKKQMEACWGIRITEV